MTGFRLSARTLAARTLAARTLAAGALLMLIAGCQPPRQLYVDGAYVKLNANPDNPAAGYFTIHGGAEDVTLRSVQTDVAQKLELHESMSMDGKMTMKPIENVDVPAGETVSFAPGGKHVMIWQINGQAIAAGKMQFRMTFSNGEKLLVDAVIQNADGSMAGDGFGKAPTAVEVPNAMIEH